MGNKRIIPPIVGFSKVQITSFVKMKIGSDPEWAKRACVSIFEQQTQLERQKHISMGHNGAGFGKLDAPLLSHIAAKIRQNRATLEDIDFLKCKMPKYAAQLICLAHDKDGAAKLKMHLAMYYRDQKKNMPY